MASSVIFMTFQEPSSQQMLDVACMTVPWLFILGFSVAFSAIFAKLRRLNMVVTQSMRMNYANVKPTAVLGPFLVLTLTNVVLLLVWTIVDPWVWTRVTVKSYDAFGRNTETHGNCVSQEGDGNLGPSQIVIICLVIWNFVAVLGACYQAYLTRNMPSDFNEAYYLSLCMAMLLEGFLLGGPLLFMVGSQPTASFLVRAVLVVLVCLSILGPMFLPKIYKRQTRSRKSGWSQFWASQRSNKRDNTGSGLTGASDDTPQRSRFRWSSDRGNSRGNHNSLSHGSLEANDNTSAATSGGASAAQLAMLKKVSADRRAEMAAIYATTSVSQLKANIKKKQSAEPPPSGSKQSLGSSEVKQSKEEV